VTATFADRVAEVVASLPPGTVATYGEVAEEAGTPGAARAVGSVLREHGARLPWWRVVTATGRLVPGLETEHARRLEAEGVACRDGRVRSGARPRRRRSRPSRPVDGEAAVSEGS
jgi:methylated-DNA-protein-cysteine methyltransferase related protein